MGVLGTITLTGTSGKQYGFSIYARSTTFKAIGILYVMAKKTPEGRYKLIYIGQTGDASNRPLNHHGTDCFDSNGADHILLLAEGNQKFRFEIETDLIQNYNTPCNKQ